MTKHRGECAGSRRLRALSALLAILAFFAAAPPGNCAPPAAKGRTPGSSRWIRIDYDDLVDRSAYTHGNRTVGDLLKKGSGGSAALAKSAISDLQPFLEPFSFVCNDIVAAMKPPGGKPYANIIDDYPRGSRQPAWAALFREGQYQLFYGDGRARLFLKGERPSSLFLRDRGVVRHPLLKVLGKTGAKRLTLEVYAFRNDYATRTLSLDTTPYVTEVAIGDLGPKVRELPREELAEFFAQAPLLEAAEIDETDGLTLFGKKGAKQTIAGKPLSIEDFAVVYRSFFHNGGNPPYVSIDRAEDSRQAKVNFGGHLQDTRVGSVLLEADKLFKTVITGLDPDTRKPVADRIRAAVPGFRPVDERASPDGKSDKGMLRFWFYPDRIRTVTDGRIGVVESHRFTADEERVDGKKRSYPDGRDAVTHLNRNFESYAGAFPPLRELETVGRMMAVVKWLRDTDARRRIDLDALLSVELSAHATPGHTRRLLAATEILRITRGGSTEEIRKVASLDNILERGAGNTDDRAYIDSATQYARQSANETLLAMARRLESASVSRIASTSLTGGVNLDPAGIAPPRKAPDSPLIARFRKARLSAGTSPAGAGSGMIRSRPRRSAAPPVKKEAAPPPSVKNEASPPTKKKAADVLKEQPERKPVSDEPPLRALTKDVVVKTNAYKSEILVTGSASKGGTIVLRKGKALPGR